VKDVYKAVLICIANKLKPMLSISGQTLCTICRCLPDFVASLPLLGTELPAWQRQLGATLCLTLLGALQRSWHNLDRSPDKHASRLVALESGLGLESELKFIFAGLGLGLRKICNRVHF